MRAFRSVTIGRGQSAMMTIQGAPTSMCRTKKRTWIPSSDQKKAKKLANQLNYGNTAYSYDGKPAPSFYGYEGTGYGFSTWSFETVANINNFGISIWVMAKDAPRSKVKYAKAAEYFNQNLQHFFNEVPVPELARVPSGKIQTSGTDKNVAIWCPSTDQYWEFFGFKEIEAEPGKFECNNGAYLGPDSPAGKLNEFKGIYPYTEEGQWGVHACGTLLTGGVITTQDIIEVLQGGKIEHAVGLAVCSNNFPATLPCVRYDTFNGLPSETPSHTPNPPYNSSISKDAIKEGTWYRFPPESTASEFGIEKPIEKAIFEAVRDYGMYDWDSAGVQAMTVESTQSLGSPYSYAKVNPWHGSEQAGKNGGTWIPESWRDTSLPLVTEQLYSGNGEKGFTSGAFKKQPWKELERLESFTHWDEKEQWFE